MKILVFGPKARYDAYMPEFARELGAELVEFSPLTSRHLPSPGGSPRSRPPPKIRTPRSCSPILSRTPAATSSPSCPA